MIFLQTPNRSMTKIQSNLNFACSTLKDLREGYCENKRRYKTQNECHNLVLFYDCNITRSDYFAKNVELHSFGSKCELSPLNTIDNPKCSYMKINKISNEYCICKFTNSEEINGSMSCLCFPKNKNKKKKEKASSKSCPYNQSVRRLCTSSKSRIGEAYQSHENGNYICFTYNEDLEFEKSLLNCSSKVHNITERYTREEGNTTPLYMLSYPSTSFHNNTLLRNIDTIGSPNKLIQNKDLLSYFQRNTIFVSMLVGFLLFASIFYIIKKKIRRRESNVCV